MEKKKKQSPRLYWLALIPVLAVAGYVYSRQNTTAVVSKTTEATATKGDLIIGFDSDGTATLPFGNLDFEVSGKLTSLNVAVGDQIQVGQVVATIDDTEYKRSLASAEIAYQKAQITYNQKKDSLSQSLATEADKLVTLKQQWQLALSDYNAALAMKDAYSQSEVDAKKRSSDDAKRSYDLALSTYNYDKQNNSSLTLEKLNLESAKMQLDVANENLAKTVLKAKAPGVVLNLGKAVGDTVNSNNDAGSLTASSSHLIVYSDSKKFQVTTSVSEQDLPLVTLNQKVNVTFDALEGKTYTGKVIHIDKLPTTDSSGIVSYEVIAELDSGFEEIGIGMTCTATLIQKEALGVVIVPNKAVTMESGVQYVNVKTQDGSITKTPIKAGLTDGRNAAVTEGLNGGETLVITTSTAKAE